MHATVVLAAGDKTNNFLIPNGTFFFELLCFLVVLWVLGKKIVPRITQAIDARQQTIRQQFEDAKTAKEDAERARQEYQDALAETRREISRLREEANAIAESERAKLATERQQILLSLRNEIGELAFTLSEKIVHESLRADDRQRQLVDDFIAGVGTTIQVEATATAGQAG